MVSEEYRTKAGYKQSEIADVLRCTTGNYSKYERNELEISIRERWLLFPPIR